MVTTWTSTHLQQKGRSLSNFVGIKSLAVSKPPRYIPSWMTMPIDFNYSCLLYRLSQGNALNWKLVNIQCSHIPQSSCMSYIQWVSTTRAMHTTEAVVRKSPFAVITSSLLLWSPQIIILNQVLNKQKITHLINERKKHQNIVRFWNLPTTVWLVLDFEGWNFYFGEN